MAYSLPIYESYVYPITGLQFDKGAFSTMTTKPINKPNTANQANEDFKSASPFSSIREIPKGYQEFTERTNWQRQRVKLRRCLAKRRNVDAQCNSIAVNEKNVCRIHGGGRGGRGSGNLTEEGRENRLKSITKDGTDTREIRRKNQVIAKEADTLKQLSQALDLRPFTGAPQNKPTLADVLPLLAELEL